MKRLVLTTLALIGIIVLIAHYMPGPEVPARRDALKPPPDSTSTSSQTKGTDIDPKSKTGSPQAPLDESFRRAAQAQLAKLPEHIRAKSQLVVHMREREAWRAHWEYAGVRVELSEIRFVITPDSNFVAGAGSLPAVTAAPPAFPDYEESELKTKVEESIHGQELKLKTLKYDRKVWVSDSNKTLKPLVVFRAETVDAQHMHDSQSYRINPTTQKVEGVRLRTRR
jgi:hypothetical protein